LILGLHPTARPPDPCEEHNGKEHLVDHPTEFADEGFVSEVIRPAAVIPEEAARAVLMALALRDVRVDGVWEAEPSVWRRFDKSFDGLNGTPGTAELIGTIQIAYGVPTRYEITIFRATITKLGGDMGWSVNALCDEALAYGGLTLATCPRADLKPPPRPFHFHDVGAR
jgi:hypothetical protein